MRQTLGDAATSGDFERMLRGGYVRMTPSRGVRARCDVQTFARQLGVDLQSSCVSISVRYRTRLSMTGSRVLTAAGMARCFQPPDPVARRAPVGGKQQPSRLPVPEPHR